MAKTELKEGQKAPAIGGTVTGGEKVTMKSFAGKTLVFFWYPKAMTSGWTTEAREFRAKAKQFEKAGAAILGASMDSLERQEKFAAKEKLTYPLLADDKVAVAKKYGVYQLKKLYGREYWGLMRSTFVIGPDGKIAKIWPKVKVKGHVDEVLAFVKELAKSG